MLQWTYFNCCREYYKLEWLTYEFVNTASLKYPDGSTIRQSYHHCLTNTSLMKSHGSA